MSSARTARLASRMQATLYALRGDLASLEDMGVRSWK